MKDKKNIRVGDVIFNKMKNKKKQNIDQFTIKNVKNDKNVNGGYSFSSSSFAISNPRTFSDAFNSSIETVNFSGSRTAICCDNI
jgi:hypothetical protein